MAGAKDGSPHTRGSNQTCLREVVRTEISWLAAAAHPIVSTLGQASFYAFAART